MVGSVGWMSACSRSGISFLAERLELLGRLPDIGNEEPVRVGARHVEQASLPGQSARERMGCPLLSPRVTWSYCSVVAPRILKVTPMAI
jgi:hypothetical protein